MGMSMIATTNITRTVVLSEQDLSRSLTKSYSSIRKYHVERSDSFSKDKIPSRKRQASYAISGLPYVPDLFSAVGAIGNASFKLDFQAYDWKKRASEDTFFMVGRARAPCDAQSRDWGKHGALRRSKHAA